MNSECGTNRVTINPSERPQTKGPYTSKPPRRQSYQDLIAKRRHPQADGLYEQTMREGSIPAPPSVKRPIESSFRDEEPPTLPGSDADDSMKSSVRARVDVEQSGTADAKKGR